MAMSSRDWDTADLVADFDTRIEALRREGVPSYPPLGGRKPWAETPEPEKLEAIAWESTNIWLRDGSSGEGEAGLHVISVPGAAALAAIERHVDYAGLPPVQREMLEDLRTKLDAGQLDGPQPDRKDLAALALARIVGIGEFEEKLGALKADEDRPWAEVPEDVKAAVLVDMAEDAGPPGAYTLSAIEREVDYGKLPPWRRDGLERLRDRLDRGELDGEYPNPSYQGDRAELALRLTELEARVASDKRVGHEESSEDWHWSWREVPEADKFDLVMGHIRELHLESQAAAYLVLGREVDLKSVRKDQWWEFEDGRREAWPRPAADASVFDRLAADPRRQWYADGHGDGMAAWEDLSVSRQIEFLARYATRHDVSLERFTEAARPILGIEPGQDFPRDSEWQLRRQFRYAHLGYSEERGVIPPYPALNEHRAIARRYHGPPGGTGATAVRCGAGQRPVSSLAGSRLAGEPDRPDVRWAFLPIPRGLRARRQRACGEPRGGSGTDDGHRTPPQARGQSSLATLGPKRRRTGAVASAPCPRHGCRRRDRQSARSGVPGRAARLH